MLHNIYNIYVKVGCEFEINISFIQRDKLSEMLDNLDTFLEYDIDLRGLFLLFESSKEEMYKLQLFSFQRYNSEKEDSHLEESSAGTKTQLSQISREHR